MKIDTYAKVARYMKAASETAPYQSAMYLAVKDAVDQCRMQIPNARKTGTILQLATYFDAIELDDIFYYLTKESDEFQAGRKDGKRIHDALVRGDIVLPEPEDIERSLEDICAKYRELITSKNTAG